MSSVAEHIHAEVKSCIEKYYLKEIENQLNEEVQQMIYFIKEVDTFYESGFKEWEKQIAFTKYKLRLHELIKNRWTDPNRIEFSSLYENFAKSFQPLFDQLEVCQTREQKPDRFLPASGDEAKLRALKFYKRNFFYISRWPIRFINLFKKKQTKIHYWKHTIPVRNLAIRHYKDQTILKLKGVTDLFFERICHYYLEVKKWEECYVVTVESGKKNNSSRIQSTVLDFEKKLIQEIRALVDGILVSNLQSFISDYDKAGTIEYQNSLLKDSAVERFSREVEDEWAKNNYGWKNTLFALFEEWRSDLDIHILRHKTLSEFDQFKSSQTRQLNEQIKPEIDAIEGFIKSASDALSVKADGLQKELKRLNYEAGKKLDKELVPRLCDKLSGQKVTNLINKLELLVKQSVEGLSDEHVIVKNDVYNHPMGEDELYKVSLYDLITFETLVAFQGRLGAIKTKLFASLESITAMAQDLDHIVSYSFSSAISAIEEEKKPEKEAVIIALEGLNRASGRLEETRQNLSEFMGQNNVALEEAIDTFCNDILKLTANDNARELRLRITKAKNAKQAEQVKKQLRDKIESRRKLALSAFRRIYVESKALLSEVGEKFVLTAKKPQLTKEVSNFLLESQEIINHLPLIYRRLYRIEPLEDLELFEGREEELSSFREAFESWDKGRFASTAILGEKWGGLTTFLNYAIGKSNFRYPISRLASKENVYDEKELIAFLKSCFKKDSLESLEQIVEYLNSGNKRIVILEDLQNLYLRKVGGFNALKAIFQLVTLTNKNVFWITSTTLYTWSYLSKTIHIEGFFSYVIQMKELKDQQIVDIIWKRNRISGFDIQFEPDKDHLDDRKFNSMDVEEQQAVLKKEFFSDLNAFAKSNVSMALIFWLLSTKKVNQESILIGTFKKPDLNFLTTLSMDKIHALHALILHDGLVESQLSEVLHSTEISGRLTLLELLEDGILLEENGVFMVNPILYRNTINLLKSKNLIH
ncbi:MAG: hypothetical protein JXR03_10590 [Cyclobacteriaceae bacterium]